MEKTPMVTELFPIIATRDLERSLAFYRDGLGARITYEFPGENGAAVYVGLSIGTSSLGIGLETALADPPLPRPVALWAYVDDCDATVEALRSAGVRVTAEPADQPWGERVARVLDPDGNEVIIGSRAAT